MSSENNHDTVIEAETEFDDEGYATSINHSYVTSIASDIRRGVEENGRLYPTIRGNHVAYTPMDEGESDRNDLQHCKFTILLDGRLHLSPIADNPTDILDLGTGTGIWCIDMADKHPCARVIGVDLECEAPIQPSWVPPECQFEIDDIEEDWTWDMNRFDFIHGRELMLAIHDWPRLLRQTFDHLKPGGYAEFAGTYAQVSCDDGTMPPNTAYEETGHIWFAIGDALGVSCRAPSQWKSIMEQVGFVDVQQHIFKIPSNPWPKDKRLKRLGAFELVQYREQVSGIFVRGFVRGLGRSQEEWEAIIAQARKEVSNMNMHSYVKYYVVFGKKPES